MKKASTTTPTTDELKIEFEEALLREFSLPEQEANDPDIAELHNQIRYAVSLCSACCADSGNRGMAAFVQQLLSMQRQNIGKHVQQALMQKKALTPGVAS
jgi:hypothetical protein